MLKEKTIELLSKRGIDEEIASRLGWYTGKNDNEIIIPFFRNGKVVNNKSRTLSGDKKFWQDKGGEQCFYNLAACEEISKLSPEDQRTRPIIIVEGEMDCAIALQCGYLAVSVPAGAPDKPVEGEETKKYTFLEDFPKFAVALLAVDDDAPGRALRQDLALRLGWHRCKWTQYPKGCKDLNDVFVKYGRKGVNMVLQEKTHFMNEGGLFLMSQLPAQPELPTFPCNIGDLSDMIKLRPGDTIVITGLPSGGKTLFVNCLACNMARDYGWNVCFGSFEQNPRADHLRYLRMHYLGKAERDHAGNPQWSDTDILAADAWIDRQFSFIVPDVNTDDLVTLKWVLSRVRAAVTQHGARLVIIDPWNELDHDRPPGMSLTEYTGYAIKEFKRLAKQYMITVIIVAHPAKMEKNRDGGYDMPALYDISDSSHWANKCDIGIIVHRMMGEDDGDFATVVRIAKVRYWGIIGRIGERFMQYLPDRGTYIDYPDFLPKTTRKAVSKMAKAEKMDTEPEKQKGLEF